MIIVVEIENFVRKHMIRKINMVILLSIYVCTLHNTICEKMNTMMVKSIAVITVIIKQGFINICTVGLANLKRHMTNCRISHVHKYIIIYVMVLILY